MSEPVVLALDLGRSCGWACSTGGQGVMKVPPLNGYDAASRHGHLGWHFEGWLLNLLTETDAGVVVIERMVSNPRFKGHEGQRVELGLRMLALKSCYGRELAVDEVSPATWKAWARKHLPGHVKSDLNDARAILAWWMAVRAPDLESD